MGFKNAFKQIFKGQIYSSRFISVLAFFVFFFIFFFIVSSNFLFIFLAVISFVMFFVFLYLYARKEFDSGENHSFPFGKFISLAVVFISIGLIILYQTANFNSLFNAVLSKGTGNYLAIAIGAIFAFTIAFLIFIIIILRKRKK